MVHRIEIFSNAPNISRMTPRIIMESIPSSVWQPNVSAAKRAIPSSGFAKHHPEASGTTGQDKRSRGIVESASLWLFSTHYDRIDFTEIGILMGPSSTLTDEPGRLDAVRRYDVLDTPPDGAFDRITALAARLCDVPIAIVSIVDVDRIWFKSHHGLDAQQASRDPGLCASAILQTEPWVVADASKDPRTLANPLVAGESGFRFYLGIPLKTHDGFNLGTLCVIDREPREATDGDIATLRDLAAIVVDELELRLSSRVVIELETRARLQAEDDSTSFHKVSESLQAGLQTNREIGQAVGLMMAFHKITDVEAFEMLSKSSQDMNMKLNRIAHQVVRHHNSRGDDVAP